MPYFQTPPTYGAPRVYEVTVIEFHPTRGDWIVDGASAEGYACWATFDAAAWCDRLGDAAPPPERAAYRRK